MDFTNIYLTVTKYFFGFYNSLKRQVIDTKEVSIIKSNSNNSNNNPTSVIMRYFVLRVLTYLTRYLEFLKKKVDMRINLVKIVKDTPDGKKAMIIQSDNKKLMLSDIIDYVDKKGVDKTFSNCIFLKFDIVTGEEIVCLKKHLVEYRDVLEDHSNTLENIVKFSSIQVNDDSKLNFIKYINKEKKEFTLDYKNIANKHINYFCKIE